MTSTDTPKHIHHGRNVKRFREMMGLKQDAFAQKLGKDWTQKKVSTIEAQEAIDSELLEELASALKVSPEAIKNFDEEKAIYNIQNNYDNTGNPMSGSYQCTFNFNPLDKYVETVEKNEKLYQELLKTEREKIALLEKMLAGKK